MTGIDEILRCSPFVIAEAGVNHNGDLDLAFKLVDAAAQAGADAVKFQTFRAEELVTARAPKARYQKKTTGTGRQLEMLKELELSPDAHKALAGHCRRRGIHFLSTPFDEESVDLLDGLGVLAFKVPSGELTNLPLLAHIARKRRPILLSTGMSYLEEVRIAVKAIRDAGRAPLVLLHCVSAYPAAAQDANLRAMATLARTFKVPVGYSDHTPGIGVAVAASALGARVIEKHFTLDKGLSGPDHRMSLDPAELSLMVCAARAAQASLGDGVKVPRPCEKDVRRAARRSLVLTRSLPAGEKLTSEHLAAKRPGTGIAPAELEGVLGRRLRSAGAADSVLTWAMLVPEKAARI